VDVIDTAERRVIATVEVGLDPVAVAVRPDGKEVWVANHVSDSVSVIDTDPASVTLHEVVETIQSLDAGGATLFDEPVGIAFASNTKAYVALSSRNEIAIVDAASYAVVGSLALTAQDPRALAVRGGRLYVAAFESGNQSELSACVFAIPGNPLCSLGAANLMGVGQSPNLPGVPKNVVRDPDVPDRDLFVFDTATDQPVGGAVTNVGTLLYGIAVSGAGRVFVTNTDARNHALDGNGLAAPIASGFGMGLGLEHLANRAFRNRVTRIDCSGAACTAPTPVDLEPPPGSPVPVPLATPYGVALSADDSLLVVTAAASSRVATLDAASLAVLDSLDVGAIPKGVALASSGATGTAYVLNSLGGTVSVIGVGAGGALTALATIAVGSDATPTEVQRGRIAFNDAGASSSGTFACASCHPDAHVDHLLWVIGASCDGCDQEEPRLTMPIRGLANTVPLHWDGTLGDPVGGRNGEVGVGGSAPANCDGDDPQSCFRQLVGASLAGVMCEQPGCPAGPSGEPGRLTSEERDALARYLSAVAYPPARSRAIDDRVSASALDGFADFFMEQGGSAGNLANTCADTQGGCHALPLGVSTNSIVVGAFEAPTMRGMTDRFIHFSSAFTSPQEILDAVAAVGGSNGVIPWNPAQGLDELVVFSAGFVAFQPAYDVFPDDMFQMFEEASTGFSGATGRQLTLNTATATFPEIASLMSALEAADLRGAVNLRAAGLRAGARIVLSFRPSGVYENGNLALTPAQLRAEAAAGTALVTLTAALRSAMGDGITPQPLLAPATAGAGPTGDPDLPVLPGDDPMTLAGIDVFADASVLVDGAPVAATLSCVGGSFTPFCSSRVVRIDLTAIPSTNGTHLLQVQNPNGPLSNELPICVGLVAGCL
jgi:DNA-binding beta-propeller fold protein YncE